jgi:chaperonin GroES
MLQRSKNRKKIMITPLKDRVIIELIQKETVTASGIVLSSADPTEANRGIVLAVGAEVLDLKVGDVILANWNKATKSKVDQDEFYIIKEEDIIAVFED